ncbi:Uncharacterised protein [Buttiauxella agrestis]|uniref:Uncharacterized protein n=1 Tax=Buttiauxella agrestis TaxID=82977 RepID=A0A381KMV2_9ENTR|nr:Uncharacterised protein [Buttiauxella agrestis]
MPIQLVRIMVSALLESSKRYLWHGNVTEALEYIDDCGMYCDDPELSYAGLKSLQKHLDEIYTYIRNNKMMIPNYGEMYRYGEPGFSMDEQSDGKISAIAA